MASASIAWTERRVDLRSALAELNSDFEELYSRAIDLLSDTPSRTRLMLAAHCLRELVNAVTALPRGDHAVLVPPRADIDRHARELRDEWERDLEVLDPPSGSDAADVPPQDLDADPDTSVDIADMSVTIPIPRSVYLAARAVVLEVARGTATARTRYALLIAEDPVDQAHPAVGTLKTHIDFFLNWTHHDRSSRRDLPTEDDIVGHLEGLEEALQIRTARFFEIAPDVRSLLENANRKRPTSTEAGDG